MSGHYLGTENPALAAELTAAEVVQPAAEVLPKLIGEKATQELLRRGKGRPEKPDKKINQTIRIDPDVLKAYRNEGKGWQTRINEVLRRNMPQRPR